MASARGHVITVVALQVLKSVPLRNMANKMAYYDKERLATEDALRIGRLHTFLPGAVQLHLKFICC